ncbi:glucose dehydrogenase [FAD, quinone]-like [Eriocheir sinensis]|uniref:glucose dehydrogenase [FAD, quinone]-like n=1 Tax=Eriocheir sinensis TaxID=95602 RepID=UPI0021C60AE5|nr:glucose dehydrogenase [FAD, quinone]-like [Eriocheir sinensis]
MPLRPSPNPTSLINSSPFSLFPPSACAVGGGCGGGVVGARLAEAGWQVLVIEAGPAPTPETTVPGLNVALYFTDTNWEYHIAPQRYSNQYFIGKGGRILQGRVMGGSASTGGLVYARGNRRDYDLWAELGNPGWDYESVLPYFKRSEDFQGPLPPGAEAFHGRGGPLGVTRSAKSSPVTQAFLAAGRELGFSEVDSNSGSQVGFARSFYTTKNGARTSPAEDWIRSALLTHPNLHVLTDATVQKILFDHDKRAVGVEFVRGKERRVVRVTREVVLSAGALATPKLLMLSGVGPAAHLQKHGIPVLLNLPGVGQNLQDHFNVHGLSWTVPKGALGSPNMFTAALQYYFSRTGPFTEPLGDKTTAWVNVGSGDSSWPNIQCHILSSTPAFDFGLFTARLLSISSEKYNAYFGPILGAEGFTIECQLSRPKSRGEVLLRSRNPDDYPIVDPNFLSHPDDVDTLVKGIKFGVSIANTSALGGRFGAKLHKRLLPGCEHYAFGSDGYWACYVRHMGTSYIHPCGTAKMGPPEDPTSVLDENLKVRGVSGLRVVDASAIPAIPSANIMAAVMMIGERAADLITEDWRGRPPRPPS